MSNESEQLKRKARRTLVIIFAVCVAPFVLATIAFNYFPPSDHTNYGELLPPAPVPGTTLEKFKGKWVMLQFDSGSCDQQCETKLFNMRQSRIAQGREMDRIERVWVRLDDKTPPEKIAPLYEGAHLTGNPEAEFVEAFPGDVRAHIYLIDPLGNLMMRFPPDADPKKMIKDLGKLLKVSRVG